MKTLIIAEKPSVALDLSRALGGFTKQKDYYESDQYVLSSSVGHLLTLVNPDDVKRGKWSFANLPAIPKKSFDLTPIDKRSKERLSLLLKLIKRKDVGSIINACDAGREGELIFRYIIQYSKTKKPIQRLWLQSMTKSSILEAFESLRTDEQMKPLEAAARSRAEADWLIGINGTRAMTAFNSKEGGFFKTTVGRVQTPTLKIVFDRSEEIAHFKPTPYWELHATFEVASGTYEARYIHPNFKKDPKNPHAREYRIWTETAAKALLMSAQSEWWQVEDTSKPSNQYSGLLFDLTSLQREANARFGFSAKMTLSIAQALYEKHKLLTYPRTDSRYLPEDYMGVVNEVLTNLANSASPFNQPHIPFAREILDKSWVKPSKRVFDSKKVSDHFAIIPT
nr:DNA topoisomerase [Alcaligenaceae bacterium]